MFVETAVSRAGSESIFEYRSMYALAMPSSSPAAATLEPMSFFANSPSSRAERSATSCSTRATSSWFIGGIFLSMEPPSAGCKPRDAVRADLARQLPIVVQVMQVRDRLAHGEKNLAGIELALEQQLEHVVGRARRDGAGSLQLGEAFSMVRLELRDARVRAAERQAVRRQHQQVGGKFAVAPDRFQEQAQRIRMRIDGPHGNVG